METLSEIVKASRPLARASSFTAFCVLTISLGVGTTAAFVSAFHALFKRQPVRQIERVVDILRIRPGSQLSRSDFAYIREHHTVFIDLLPWTRAWEVIATGIAPAELVPGELVGGNYFEFVGATVMEGRTLQTADDRSESQPVVVISYATWQRLFRGDKNVVGRRLRINGHSVEVVGVASRGFHGIAMPNVSPTAFWLPVSFAAILRPDRILGEDDSGLINLRGRLRPEKSPIEAAAELQLLASQLDQVAPVRNDSDEAQFYQTKRLFQVRPAGAVRMSESSDATAMPLGVAAVALVAIVFLVACTNIAILNFARRRARRREIAVRVALGASRARLICDDLLEGALLAAAGGVGGVVAAWAILRYLSKTAQQWPGFTSDMSFEFGGLTLVVCVGATACVYLFLGVIPALRRPDRQIVGALAGSAAGSGSDRWRMQRALVAMQVGLTFVLVAMATLCVRQSTVGRRDAGFEMDRLALVQLNFRYQRFSPQRARIALEGIVERVRRLPGVEAACLASALPVGRTVYSVGRVTSADRPFLDRIYQGREAIQLVSTPEVFRTLGIRLVHGRQFDRTDVFGGPPVAVVSELTARRLFGTADAVGRSIIYRPLAWAGEPVIGAQTLTVIGVAADTDTYQIGNRDTSLVYLPFSQNTDKVMIVAARATGTPSQLIQQMKSAVWSVDPELASYSAGTGAAMAGVDDVLLRNASALSAAVAAATLGLSLVGMAGVLVSAITRRRHEIAVRIALGAGSAHIARMIIVQALWPVVVGVACGLAVTAVARMAFRPLFVRFVPAVDPSILLAIPLPLLLAAVAACYVPVRLAIGTDANVVLKEQ